MNIEKEVFIRFDIYVPDDLYKPMTDEEFKDALMQDLKGIINEDSRLDITVLK